MLWVVLMWVLWVVLTWMLWVVLWLSGINMLWLVLTWVVLTVLQSAVYVWRCKSPGMWRRVVRCVASNVSKDRCASIFRVTHTVCPMQPFFLRCLTLNYLPTDTASHPSLHLQDHHVIMFCHVLYRELGCAAGIVPFHGLPSQSVTVTPGASSSSIPSQNTPPSLVDATFVKIVFWKIVFIALGFVLLDVPGKVIITCRE